MGTQIYNAGYDGQYGLRVDSNGRGHTQTVTETEATHATEVGDGYNINTGTIGLTSTTASGVLYFKNNETKDVIIDAIAIGIGSAGTTTDSAEIKLIKNPTTGTLISSPTNVDMNQNRNHSSSNTLADSLAYKGAEGNTVTDGTEEALFYQSAGGRLYASIGLVIGKGNSIAITVDTQTTSGTTNVYAALILHLKDEASKD
jgi:hypothetical protein